MAERDVPTALDAERALIGAALIDAPRVVGLVEHLIVPGDFFRPFHQACWQAITDLVVTSRVDPVTVADALAKLGVNPPGGEGPMLEVLAAFIDTNPGLSIAGSYAQLIIAARIRRDVIAAAADLTGDAYNPGVDAADLLDSARGRFAALDLPTSAEVPLNVVDFMESVDYRTTDWLADRFLEHGDRILFTAHEGGGKSVLLTQLAVQLAAGVHPWSLRRQRPVPVLLIDGENGPKRLARRCDWLVGLAPPDFEPDMLRTIARPRGINLHRRADRLWLMDQVRLTGARVLVIGPAYKLASGVAARGDAGGEQHTLEVTDALDELRTRFGVTLIMETHAPHGGPYGRDLRPAGSSVWLRWPEFGVGLRRDKEQPSGNRYFLEHWRGPRDERLWPAALVRGAGRWPWSAVMPDGTFDPGGTQGRLGGPTGLADGYEPPGDDLDGYN